MADRTFCTRNFKSSVLRHPCTGGPRCKGTCKPPKAYQPSGEMKARADVQYKGWRR